MYKSATQQMFNSSIVGCYKIKFYKKQFNIKKFNRSKYPASWRGQGASPTGGTGGLYPCNAAAPLTISVSSVVMAACLARL